MIRFIATSSFFGAVLSLIFYLMATFLYKKFKLDILNPLLVATCATVAVLVLCKIDYETYYNSAKMLGTLLTPATVCLAVPLYEKLALLRQNWQAILAGIAAGVLSSLSCVFVLSLIFGLSHAEYVSFLPKSVTTAIGMDLATELGGHASLAVVVISVTGLLGNFTAPTICRLFKITDPVARGVGIGTASHALGTAKAIEMGETEGAMSGLAIAVSGLMTAAIVSFFANLI